MTDILLGLGAVSLTGMGIVIAVIKGAHITNFTESMDTPKMPTKSPKPVPMPRSTENASNGQLEASTRVYNAAKANLRKHLTLNTEVNPEYGCAEAVSTCLKEAGYTMPEKGIPTVNGLIEWMQAVGFKEVSSEQTGAVITAHMPDKNDPSNAHVGICLEYGIASNDSRTQFLGKFLENYTYQGWNHYFGVIHGCQIRYFLPV